MLCENLAYLRKVKSYSQEYLAEQLNVSRQSVAKWESGESVPDVEKCAALARLFGVTLDDLVNFMAAGDGIGIPPKGKHLFGRVIVDKDNKIEIPPKACEIFGIKPGDGIIVLGDEQQGLAMIKEEAVQEVMKAWVAGEK